LVLFVIACLSLGDEPLTSRKFIGALFGVFGVAVIVGLDALIIFSLQNLGQLVVMGAALFYGFAGVCAKRFLSSYPQVTNAFGILSGSTILIIPVVIFTESIPVKTLSTGVRASLIGVAIVSIALAYILYFNIMVLAGSANLILVTLLIPPIGVTLSVVFLGEKLGYAALIRFGIIALGLVITDGRLLD
jgi:drug/metabolite transporter (DMT)-like permease